MILYIYKECIIIFEQNIVHSNINVTNSNKDRPINIAKIACVACQRPRVKRLSHYILNSNPQCQLQITLLFVGCFYLYFCVRSSTPIPSLFKVINIHYIKSLNINLQLLLFSSSWNFIYYCENSIIFLAIIYSNHFKGSAFVLKKSIKDNSVIFFFFCRSFVRFFFKKFMFVSIRILETLSLSI